jgi:hypothetical protein
MVNGTRWVYSRFIQALRRCTHWVPGAGVRTHWVPGAGVLGCWVRLGVPGFLGEGGGPTVAWSRLRWHHRTCENF